MKKSFLVVFFAVASAFGMENADNRLSIAPERDNQNSVMDKSNYTNQIIPAQNFNYSRPNYMHQMPTSIYDNLDMAYQASFADATTTMPLLQPLDQFKNHKHRTIHIFLNSQRELPERTAKQIMQAFDELAIEQRMTMRNEKSADRTNVEKQRKTIFNIHPLYNVFYEILNDEFQTTLNQEKKNLETAHKKKIEKINKENQDLLEQFAKKQVEKENQLQEKIEKLNNEKSELQTFKNRTIGFSVLFGTLTGTYYFRQTLANCGVFLLSKLPLVGTWFSKPVQA